MDQATLDAPRAEASSGGLLPRELVERMRRLTGFALGSAVVYSWLTNAGQSGCFGGVGSDGGFIDADGQVTSQAPRCISVTLGPSWLFIAAIAVAVLIVLNHVVTRSRDVDAAIRLLDRTVVVIVYAALAAVVIGHVWFWQVSLDDLRGSYVFFNPYLVANITIEHSAMSTP